MSTYRWIPWTQPVISSNNDYGETSASSQNASSTAFPWKAADGIHEGSNTSWEAARDAYPAWWLWRLPVMLRITKLVLYNKYSSYDYVTKNVSVYADKDQTQLIASGKFDAASFSTLTFDFDTPVITNELCIVCEDSYKESNTYVGLGEVEITAEQGIEQFDVRYFDWDGTLLKSETVDFGGSVAPPADPVRVGYTFTGWSASTEHVVSDMTVVAQYSRNPREDDFLLTTLTELVGELQLPLETGVFKKQVPDCYVVFTPLSDSFELFADNQPHHETQEVRISLYDKSNYLRTKNLLVRALLDADITITDRRYLGHEDSTGYHHYAIDVAQLYELEE
jgi:hypothetical protein